MRPSGASTGLGIGNGGRCRSLTAINSSFDDNDDQDHGNPEAGEAEAAGGHYAMAAAIGLMIASLPKVDSEENFCKRRLICAFTFH